MAAAPPARVARGFGDMAVAPPAGVMGVAEVVVTSRCPPWGPLPPRRESLRMYRVGRGRRQVRRCWQRLRQNVPCACGISPDGRERLLTQRLLTLTGVSDEIGCLEQPRNSAVITLLHQPCKKPATNLESLLAEALREGGGKRRRHAAGGRRGAPSACDGAFTATTSRPFPRRSWACSLSQQRERQWSSLS